MNSTVAIGEGNHLTAFLTTISIVGTIGNLIVAFVYFQKRDKQTSTFFILMLAFIDLSVCSVLVPMTIYMENILFETSSIILCKTFFFLTTTTVPMSSLLMTAIAFDRYFCICMVSKNIMTLVKARFLAIILFIVSALCGVIPALAAVTIIDSRTSTHENASNSITTEADHTESYYSTTSVLTSWLAMNQSSADSSPIIASTEYLCIVDFTASHTPFGVLIRPFKLCYDFIFIASVITITVLYVLIYKDVYTRRKIQRDKKRKLLQNSLLNGRQNLMNAEDQQEIQGNGGEVDGLRSMLLRVFFCFDIFRSDDANDIDINNNNVAANEEVKKQVFIPLIKVTEADAANKERNENEAEQNKNANETVINEQFNNTELTAEITRVKTSCKNKSSAAEANKRQFGAKQKQSTSIIRRSLRSHPSNKHVISTKDMRTAFMLFVVSFLYIVFYSPSIISTYLALLLQNLQPNLYLSYLFFSNSAINPIIYCFLNPNFRADLFRVFFKRGFIYEKCVKNVR